MMIMHFNSRISLGGWNMIIKTRLGIKEFVDLVKKM